MKKSICIIVCYMLCCFVPTVEAQMLFTLRDSLGNSVGNVYPVKQGETITVTLEVSNIAQPGLVSMGYSLRYDPFVIGLDTTLPNTNYIDAGYWPKRTLDDLEVGKIDANGARFSLEPLLLLPSIFGDGIPLGTFSFTKNQARGRAQFILQQRQVLGDDGNWHNPDDFVMAPASSNDLPISLDSELGSGIVVAAFTDPGDAEGDGDVDGEDLYNLISDVCTTTCAAGPIADFAKNFGY